MLQAVAWALRDQLAARGRVARMGGEEFVLLFPGSGVQEAALQCEYLREMIANLPAGLPVTVSIGVAEGGSRTRPEDVLARADAAMYEAKRRGRNRVVSG